MFRRIYAWFRGLDWSFLGVVIGVPLSFYLGLVYERPTAITCEILSQTPVLDIKGDVGSLDVLYKGENIREQNKQLTIFVFRMENTGSTTILKNQYDDKHPLGVGVENGAFAEPPHSIDYSDERLINPPAPKEKNLLIERPYRDKITYPPNILEPGDYWTDRALVIHDKDVEPSIYAFGKVGGVREIAVTVAEQNTDQPDKRVVEVPFNLWSTVIACLWLTVCFAFTVTFSNQHFKGFRRAVIAEISELVNALRSKPHRDRDDDVDVK